MAFSRGGIDIETTRPRALYWIQGLVDVWGETLAQKLVARAIKKAMPKRNSAAWVNWVLRQDGFPWLRDDELSTLVSGPPRKRRPEGEGGPVTMREALGSLYLA